MKNIQCYDKEFFYKEYFNYIKKSDFKKTGRQEMLESKLVVIDYLSTSYIECMRMDIPFIFFWDKNAYYINSKYNNFFDPLIQAGICHTDPVDAAILIEKIKNNPKKWWNNEKVQKGKNKFLEINFGEPEKMLGYLLNQSESN